MGTQPRRIRVAPESELARLLDQATDAPLLLEKNGELYRLNRVSSEQPDIWADYDPRRAKEALRSGAGALARVDTKTLLRDLHAARDQESQGRPAS